MTLVDERRGDVTEFDDRPVRRDQRTSSWPAWRVAGRLARREVRRRPGRTGLAALLIAVPVMAMTLGSVLARTNAADWTADFGRDYGAADLVVHTSPATVSEGVEETVPTVPPDGAVIGEYVMTNTFITPADADPGDGAWVDFTDLDPSNPAESVGLDVTDGEAPTVGEVLLDRDVADDLGVAIGDRLELDRPSGTWTVSGFGRMRGDYWRRIAVFPGFDVERIAPDQRSATVLIDLPDDTSVAEIRRLSIERDALNRFDDPSSRPDVAPGMAWGFVAGVLALVAVGIIVAAAFATSARRQLVTIGQLSSNGADEPVVRRSLLLQGTWTGIVGAVVGMVGGIVLLPVARPIVAERLVQHELRGFRFSLGDLVVIAVTAVVAATVAAAIPARSAARVPVMAALAGRRPTTPPPGWLVPTGTALFLGGLGLVAVAALGADGASGSTDVWAALVVTGATAMVFGTCCASPLVVERVGSLGRRTSLSWRMALRSLARSRGRSAAVVAAVAVAVGGAVAAAAVAESAIRSDYACCDPSLPDDTVRFESYSPGFLASTTDMVDLGPLEPVEFPAGVDDTIAALGDDVVTFPVLVATFDPEPFDPENEYLDPRGPVIATPELLDLIGLSDTDADTLADRGRLVQSYFAPVAAADRPSELFVYGAEPGPIEVGYPPARDRSAYPWFSDAMMTADAARSFGFDIVQTGVVARVGAPLTDDQLAVLRDAQQSLEGRWLDAFVEPGDPPRTTEQYQMDMVEPSGVYVAYEDPAWHRGGGNELWVARGVIVGAALLLSLLVVSIGLTLASAEGRDERDTFAIVGASPSSMRRQAAATAAVTALVGIVLGIPLGFTPTWVVDRITADGDASTVPVRFPWLVVVALVVVIPTVAAAGAWGASGLGHRLRPASPTRRD